MRAPYPANRLHNQHPPPPALNKRRQPNRIGIGGSILDADSPAQGVKIARRNTVVCAIRIRASTICASQASIPILFRVRRCARLYARFVTSSAWATVSGRFGSDGVLGGLCARIADDAAS